MTISVTDKHSRLNIRIRPDIKDQIERAANISGKTMTDFAVSTLSEAAEQILEHSRSVELSNRDRDIFLRVLDQRAKPNKYLRRAAKTHKKLIVK